MSPVEKLPEVSESICVGFKTDKGFEVFQIINWKVQSVDTPTKSTDGTWSCGCAHFKVRGECLHTRIASEPCWFALEGYKRVSGKLVAPVHWQAYTPLSDVVVIQGSTKKPMYVQPGIMGDVNLFNLIWAMVGPSDSLHRDDLTHPTNPLKLYEQCVYAHKNSVSIVDDSVQAIGRGFHPDVKIDSVSAAEEVVAPEPPKDTSWRKIERPDPKKFYVDKDVWEQCMYAVHHGVNVLILGPSGSGKSELFYEVMKATGRHHEVFNMGAMSEPRTSLIGNTHFDKEKGTWFQPSRFVRALQQPGSGILMDEMTRSERGAFNILLPVMDRQGYLALDESEDAAIIRRADGVCFFATANVGMEYTGTDAMDKAVKDRFAITIDMFFPPKDMEVKILMGRTGVKKEMAERLVAIADRQRTMAKADGEFIEMISTRMLIAAAGQLAAGFSLELATKFTILSQFSDDGGDASERRKVLQIIQKGK